MGVRRGERQQEDVAAEVVITWVPLREFRKAALYGLYSRVVVESDWTKFRIWGEMGNGVRATLSLARQDYPRTYSNPAAALAELKKMGVTRVEVWMEEWDVEMATLSMRQRPDVAARRLRRKRMTYTQQILEAAKTDPSMAAFVPPGTVEMGPMSREEELKRLVAQKYEEQSRGDREHEALMREEWVKAEREERMRLHRMVDEDIERGLR